MQFSQGQDERPNTVPKCPIITSVYQQGFAASQAATAEASAGPEGDGEDDDEDDSAAEDVDDDLSADGPDAVSVADDELDDDDLHDPQLVRSLKESFLESRQGF